MSRYYCNKGFAIEVLKSNAGYYIGTKDNTGLPYCRLSVKYFKTKNEAEAALEDGFEIRENSMEIKYCCKL